MKTSVNFVIARSSSEAGKKASLMVVMEVILLDLLSQVKLTCLSEALCDRLFVKEDIHI